MVTATKKPAAKASLVVKAKPQSVAAKRGTAAPKAATARKPAPAVRPDTARAPALPAQAPETKKAGSGKRQRLSKAFSRPLDKKLKKIALVRERFTLPEVEYDQLAVLKKRLAERGVGVKKSELVRAGLALLGVLDDDRLQALLAKVPPLD